MSERAEAILLAVAISIINVECFDVCQLCGIELIQVSDAIVKSLRP